MPIFDTVPNSATTLSVNYRPGQNKRLVASKSEAIFSFGDFTIERDYSKDILSSDTSNLQFSTFDNLETLNAVNFSNTVPSSFVQQNELNLPKRNPKSHSYFSSFYTNVASSINNIIATFPYAIFSYNNGNTNISEYTEYYNGITFERTCSFKIPTSGLTNQGNIALTSANTPDNFSLPYDYEKFSIQLSGGTDIFKIKNYSFSGTYLYFEIYGYLKNNSSSTYQDALYIRPSKERMFDFNESITSLETQLINEGIFLIPAIDTPQDDSFEQTFIWPKSIDGFAPDSYGNNFEAYKEKLLAAAEKIDEEKTDIFIKTVVPENYLELDSDGQIYRTVIQTYAGEFDKLKSYIDAIAYAHSVEYNGEETVPRKFLIKLGNLLGWKLSDGFSELDLFDYLTSDLDQQSNSFSYFNIEIWRRILINLVWLYKRKGTRDAIMFIFKLIGAPDCLINFNEFVYDITSTIPNSTEKVDYDGFINYNSSIYAFQQGGPGRGNGDAYINQWTPEFNPLPRIDNEKINIANETGGTRNIINSKEANLGYSTAQAIEYDVWQYFQQDCSCWEWGSGCPPFSCLTVPFEYLTFSCDEVRPLNITAMTLSQYMNYIYTNSIDPTNRKTNSQCHTTWGYPELKNIYLSYYYASCPSSNKLTMCKLENYLQLLEIQLGDYISQLIPATTIVDDNVSTIYRNPMFHRQRFVYKEGVDKGSMFKREIVPEIKPKDIKLAVLNNAKICVFTKKANSSDITGSDWRNLNNIPSQNICPSAKNVNANKISIKKIEDVKLDINGFVMKLNYITTNTTRVKSFKLTCNITNTITSVVGATSISNTIVGEQSQILAHEEISNN